MKRASWILAIFFGLVFVGATLMNASLIGKARSALTGSSPSGKPAARAGALASSAAEAERFHLVVIVPDTDDSFFEGLLDGISSEAAGVAAAVQVFRYPGQTPQGAERYFEIAIRAKVDGLIMYRSRSESTDVHSRDLAAEASMNGVVFVPVGTDLPTGKKGPFVGSDSFLLGRRGGELIAKNLGAAARVGIILPVAGSGGFEDEPLYKGVAAAIKTDSGALIVAVGEAEPGILSGEAVAESMLRSHPALNAILCSSAQETVGAAQVIIDMNQVGNVLIVGADETEDIKRYIDKGVIAASLVRDSKGIGQEAVKVFARIKTGGSVPGPEMRGFSVVGQEKASR
jgi:ribose transport system substrate-binding protein